MWAAVGEGTAGEPGRFSPALVLSSVGPLSASLLPSLFLVLPVSEKVRGLRRGQASLHPARALPGPLHASVLPSVQWATAALKRCEHVCVFRNVCAHLAAPLSLDRSRGLFQGVGQRTDGGILGAGGLGAGARSTPRASRGRRRALHTPGKDGSASLHHLQGKVPRWLGPAPVPDLVLGLL